MAGYFQQHEIDGLEYFVVLGEDADGLAPSLEYCMSYANQTGVDPARMWVDASWGALFTVMANGASGGIGLPWEAALDGRGMIYVGNSEQSDTSVETLIGGLLALE